MSARRTYIRATMSMEPESIDAWRNAVTTQEQPGPEPEPEPEPEFVDPPPELTLDPPPSRDRPLDPDFPRTPEERAIALLVTSLAEKEAFRARRRARKMALEEVAPRGRGVAKAAIRDRNKSTTAKREARARTPAPSQEGAAPAVPFASSTQMSHKDIAPVTTSSPTAQQQGWLSTALGCLPGKRKRVTADDDDPRPSGDKRRRTGIGAQWQPVQTLEPAGDTAFDEYYVPSLLTHALLPLAGCARMARSLHAQLAAPS